MDFLSSWDDAEVADLDSESIDQIFCSRFPIVMPWNEMLRSRTMLEEEDFKLQSKSIIEVLNKDMDYKLDAMGIDASLGRVDENDHREATRILMQEHQGKLKILCPSKRREYLILRAGLEQHLQRHCPAPMAFRPELRLLSRRNGSSLWWKIYKGFPVSAPEKETEFSPLKTGLQKSIFTASTSLSPGFFRSTKSFTAQHATNTPIQESTVVPDFETPEKVGLRSDVNLSSDSEKSKKAIPKSDISSSPDSEKSKKAAPEATIKNEAFKKPTVHFEEGSERTKVEGETDIGTESESEIYSLTFDSPPLNMDGLSSPPFETVKTNSSQFR